MENVVSRPDFCQSHHDPFSTYNTFGIYFGQDSCDPLWPTKNLVFPLYNLVIDI